ncbi:non-ribosomal peptide synthetase/type I polyketide synthase [Paenibacillus sp. BJ-4]|uniref:non-ribosomal peptide synthetase/type I polyketide synthase n=1 Tax=Paenibacillus sp. BJ-4 TaxID=2878097 RepID=UPI001CF07B45|nr:non-ribosomal peptide synthetase/type I polyketide synthase [Paenibacillus sp. BJ-4]
MLKKSSILEIIQQRVVEMPNQTIHTFLKDGGLPSDLLTYTQLDLRAKAIASALQVKVRPGQRAILLFNPGIHYITALFGCLYAGVIAVPAYPPRLRNQSLDRGSLRICSMIQDSNPVIVLTESGLLTQLEGCKEQVPELLTMLRLVVDHIPCSQANSYDPFDAASDMVAYLQYTSGSTSTPKGVMVTHGNLLAQCHLMVQSLRYKENSVSLIWLPPFHDWGLIEGIMLPVYNGHCGYLMDPVSFVQRPVRWLEAITQWKITHGGGPNFAFDLCIQKVTPEQICELDLSSWDSVAVSAEPVRKDTLEEFASRFATCGFRRQALAPAYGMAETTLQVASSLNNGPSYVIADASELALNRIVDCSNEENGAALPSCGKAGWDTRILIVDPETLKIRAENQVGEIWVSGRSVSAGYWNQPKETVDMFQAYTSDTNEGPFLRTGDLGFLRNEDLYFTGRLKDLIIVDGQNHYPQDIELTVEKSCSIVRRGAGAAFAVRTYGTEGVGVVYEVERSARKANLDIEAIAHQIRKAISAAHGISLVCLTLIRPGSIPKTSSGKIQRSASRNAYENGLLNAIVSWKSLGQSQNENRAIQVDHHKWRQSASSEKVETLERWICEQIAPRLGMLPEEINVRMSFSSMGLSSKETILLTGEIESYVGWKLSSTLLYEQPDIHELANYLVEGNSVNNKGSKPESNLPKPTDDVESIAIVGMACRFPGASDPEDFWRVLQRGEDCITEIPPDRWSLEEYYDADPDVPGKTYSRHGGFLSDIDVFDAGLFNISRPEAMEMDPQHRILLELSWEALERSGQSPDRLAGHPTGVFLGLSYSDYQRLQFMDIERLGPYAVSGGALSTAAGRISYCLGLQGPSIAVDTACSSSLMAVHLACQSLLNGECEIALAGGANLTIAPQLYISLSKAKMLSPTGRCHTFDSTADGYVRGEGCAVIVLKKLSDAQAAKDNILAVIRGSAANQDGRTNGLTAPSKAAQTSVIREALCNAGVLPNEVQYVEAHGTGTVLGDPIEIHALADAFCEERNAENTLFVGSVKTNIGHLESAAGIAGLLKTVLSLQNRSIPKNLHFYQPNPYIDWNSLPIKVPTLNMPWQPGPSLRRIAGVSSFGFSGTNVHVILEEAPSVVDKPITEPVDSSLQLLTLSASSEWSLRTLAERYGRFLQESPSVSLADFCHAANTTRADLQYRIAMVGATKEEMSDQLLLIDKRMDKPLSLTKTFKTPKIAFIFAGQGEAYPGMGRQLYETEFIFRKTINACDLTLQAFPAFQGRSIKAAILGEKEANNWMKDTSYVQPLLFAFQYALTELYRTWGIEPSAVSGHSLGEFSAACASGMLGWMDGLQLVAERGQLMQSLVEPGRMVAVMLGLAEVENLLAPYADRLSVAAINSAGNTVVAGDTEAIDQLCEHLNANRVDSRLLRVSHAFHSAKMDVVMEPFEAVATKYAYGAPQIPLIRNLTGTVWQAGEKPNAEYWRDHLRQPVKFAAGIQVLGGLGCDVFIEIGPTATLTHLISQTLINTVSLPSLRKGRDESRTLLETLGSLYSRGSILNWSGRNTRQSKKNESKKIVLPTYPFDKKHYWSPSVTADWSNYREARGSELTSEAELSNILSSGFESTIEDHPYCDVRKEDINYIERILENGIDRTEALAAYLHNVLASMLMLSEQSLEDQQVMSTMGFDSLMAIQLRNRLKCDLGIDLSIALLMGEATIVSIASECARLVDLAISAGLQVEPELIMRLDRKEKSFALSTSQMQLWLLQEIDPLTTAYNLPTGLRLKGTLQQDILHRCLQELLDRHEILRVRIDVVEGEPRQRVLAPEPMPLPIVDLRHLSLERAEQEARRIALEEASCPLDLNKNPLMRAQLIRLSDEDHILLLLFHHIVADGWSLVGVLLQELDLLYTAFLKGDDYPLPELRIQYVDYAQWQRSRLSATYLAPHLHYWKEHLEGASFEPCFPADRQRNAFTKHVGRRIHAYLSTDLIEAVNALSRAQNVTPFVTLVAGMKALLYRWTGREDLIIGTTVSNRTTDELEHLVGDFTNHLPLRTTVSAEKSALSFIQRVGNTVLNAFVHSECPFEKIVNAVNPDRYGNRNPLYDIAVVMHTFSDRATSLKIGPALDVSFIAPVAQIDNGTSELDLIFDLLETPKGLLIECEFDTEIFDATTIERFIQSYETLMWGLVTNPACAVKDLPLLSETEKRRLITENRQNLIEFSPQACLHQLFEKQAQSHPDNVAVVCGDSQLTYEQLEVRSNYLARRLIDLGVGQGIGVGICTERSIETVIAILGVLKTGAAYIALDPVYPTEHLNFILSDSSATFVVVQETTRERALQLEGAQIICIDARVEPRLEDGKPLKVAVSPHDLAYVLYTSGSTGNPKGALITHYNVVRLFQATTDWYHFGEKDVWTLFHSYAFDFSVWELWGALLHGGKLVVVPYTTSRSPELFLDLLREQKVTVLNHTPSAFRLLIYAICQRSDSVPLGLRYVIFGGEALDPRQLDPWIERYGLDSPQLINMYGITETTVHVSYAPIQSIQEAILHPASIGMPIPDLQIHILDSSQRPLPLGAIGEICIGGAGVFQGYLNRPDLTESRLIKNPFDTRKLLYRSGDCGRMLPGGSLEYFGRGDGQVKIRGFRIELSEIEAVIKQHPMVQDCVLQVWEPTSEDRRLVAHVVAKPESAKTVLFGEQMEQEQVFQWQTVFDTTYGQGEAYEDPTLNITGWTSSYTNQPIPKNEMHAWVEHTVAQIKRLKADCILEIGCGTGMLLFRLAPGCTCYTALDLSDVALNYIRSQMANVGIEENKVQLLHRSADDLSGLGDHLYDTVIINSMMQYLPSIEYFINILHQAVQRVKPGGTIFVGDVRNAALLEIFHTSIQFFHAPEDMKLSRICAAARHAVREENELLAEPEFFYALKRQIPQISHVEIYLKHGSCDSELVRYRYDVMLHISAEDAFSADSPECNPLVLDWQNESLTLSSLRSMIEQENPEALIVKRIPNRRLSSELGIWEQVMHGPKERTKLDVLPLLSTWTKEGIDPEELWAWEHELPYSVHVGCGDTADELHSFHAVLLHRGMSRQGKRFFLPEPIFEERPLISYANDPFQGTLARKLVPLLRTYVSERLPAHMVPSSFVILDKIPLTENGKLDHKALVEPDSERPELETVYVKPRNPIEEMLATIVSEILGIEQVGVNDNFFDLGGNSLLATQFVGRVRAAFMVEVRLVELFTSPTIALLSEHIADLLVQEVGSEILEEIALAEDAFE